MSGDVKRGDDSERRATVSELLRETADGIGQLVVQHVKLAQLDLTANLRAMGGRVAAVLACAVLFVVGYALSMVGIALMLGDGYSSGLPLAAIGFAHCLGSGIALVVVIGRLRRTKMMKVTADVLGDSAATLLAPQGQQEPLAAALPAPRKSELLGQTSSPAGWKTVSGL